MIVTTLISKAVDNKFSSHELAPLWAFEPSRRNLVITFIPTTYFRLISF